MTIMVSLRDELKLFLNFRRKFLNCQLSIVNSTTPNLSIRKLFHYLSTSKRGVFHLPALPDGKLRLSLDGRIIAPNTYFVNMLLVLFFSLLKKINDPGGKGHGDQGVGDSAERNIGQ